MMFFVLLPLHVGILLFCFMQKELIMLYDGIPK